MNETDSVPGPHSIAAAEFPSNDMLGDSLTGLGHCLVTGGNGFIGRALCQRLYAAGLEVTLLSRTGSHSFNTTSLQARPRSIIVELGCDRLCSKDLDGIDTVFHLAARTHALDDRNDADLYDQANLAGTRELLAAAQAAGCARFVFFSSVKAMGEQSPVRLDETTEPRPQSAYGRSKLAAERLVVGAAGPGFSTCVLRLPLVYGPGVKGNLRALLVALRDGRMPALPQIPNRRSMIHVDDVVQGAVLAGLRASPGETYLLTDGIDYSTSEIETLCRHALHGDAVHRQRLLPTTRRLSLGSAPALPLWILRGLAVGGDWAGILLKRRVGFDSAKLQKLTESAF